MSVTYLCSLEICGAEFKYYTGPHYSLSLIKKTGTIKASHHITHWCLWFHGNMERNNSRGNSNITVSTRVLFHDKYARQRTMSHTVLPYSTSNTVTVSVVILMLSSELRFGLSSDLFLNFLRIHLPYARYMPSHLIDLQVIILIISADEYELWSCTFSTYSTICTDLMYVLHKPHY
jgi:hypothetical protein